MRVNRIRVHFVYATTALILALPALTFGQANSVSTRLSAPIDESSLALLRGNTHPLARAEFDRGMAPPDLPMNRMLLLLQRSAEQEAALRKLLDDQQDQSSPKYHQWLSPAQFGQQFGASDQDIQAVSSWLQSHGFQISRVTNGRSVIEFSGTAAQVQEAFHTAIHKYVVNEEEHWANASDPQIPSALAPVVAGIATLHNFQKRSFIKISDQRVAARLTAGSKPQFTFSNGTHALTPADYAVIYNLRPLFSAGINGTGTTIAVVGRSNINVQDVRDFRSMTGLPPNDPQIVLDGPDPGNLGGDEEVEAILDNSWAGAVAPNATVKFVVSATTNTTDGVDLSVLYIVDNNVGDVMTESFGRCEAFATSAEATSLAAIAGQAAAQGITFMASSGDTGAEGCDNTSEVVAQGPISVSLPASLPYTVAVGGTMFHENGNDAAFWRPTNDQNGGSAISYIPEVVWNESCLATQCSNPNILAGGGGASGTSSTFSFPKPSWQSGLPGIPVDGKRDIPDVSLTAAAGHDPYLICFEGSCATSIQGQASFVGVGGTSASAPSFAGIMALVHQKTGVRQGQANYVLYRLAASETLTQCNATGAVLPAGNCIFNDVTSGNNAVPGEAGFGQAHGSYQSTLGYDLASGLGSVNAANLVNQWSTARVNGSATSLTFSGATATTFPHGSAAGFSVMVTPSNSGAGTPTGNVSLITSNGQGVGFFALSNASVSSTTNALPGASYTVTAHYEGDGTFAPSDSAPASVTVSPEPSGTTMKVLGIDANGNLIPFSAGPYGEFLFLRADVRGVSGVGTATGTVNFADNGTAPNIPGDPFPLNSEGSVFTPDGVTTIPAGKHSLIAEYGGDASFNASNSVPVSFTITQGATTTSVTSSSANVASGTAVKLTATIDTTSFGNPPTGTASFFSGAAQVGSSAVVATSSGQQSTAQGIAALTVSLPVGEDSITAHYSGDINYFPSTSGAITVLVTGPPDFSVSASPATLTIGSSGGSVRTTLTISGQNGFSGTINLSAAACSNLPAESGCNFNPASITGSGTTILTIVTSAPHNTGVIPSLPMNDLRWRIAMSGIIMVSLFLVGASLNRRRWNVFATLILLFCVAAFTSCGGGGQRGPGTPPGQSNVTITLSSGTISHSITLTLNVQ
jgi:hypothetical protein